MSRLSWRALHQKIRQVDPIRVHGKVARVVGLTVESHGPPCSIGDVCEILYSRVRRAVRAEAVGFRDDRVLLMPLGEMVGIRPGSPVRTTGRPLSVPVGPDLLGRILDGLGRPMDSKGPLAATTYRRVVHAPPSPLARTRIRVPLATGIRVLDGFATWGLGQRLGLFSGSGIGKSTLMGMIARKASVRANVVALIGERGREVREFLERDLGPEGLARSVVIVATSDQPALVRVKAASVAATIAEGFRDLGWDVILMMDSLTRVAIAQREVGLATGEPPTARGYTPSVFGLLPALLERAGTAAQGSVSGLYTVLVEGDDLNEPVSDAARAVLDGHIVLSRRLANRNHYPPVDIQASLSRVMVDIVSPEQRRAAGTLVEQIAVYREAEDLINIGAYRPGSSPSIDTAIAMKEPLDAFLRQDIDETTPMAETIRRLLALESQAIALRTQQGARPANEAVSVSAGQA